MRYPCLMHRAARTVRLGAVLLACAACERASAESDARAAPTAAVEAPPAATASATASARPSAAAASATPAVAAIDSWPDVPEPETKGDRIYSKVRFLWIRPRVGSKAWIGYLSIGDSIPVAGGDADEAFAGGGDGERCQRWYAVEPRGFVCTGTDATLDAADPVVVELARHKAKADSPWPYRYGESLGTPIYHELPAPERQRRREEALDRHLAKIDEARRAPDDAARAAIDERFVGLDLAPAGKRPPPILDLPGAGRPLLDRVVLGSTIAYTESFDHAGRTFVRTWDGGFAPKDKVRPYPESAFRGVVLGSEAVLPLAFFRTRARPQYRRTASGFEKNGKEFARLSWVELAGEPVEHEGVLYHRTKTEGVWAADDDVTIARRATDVPPQLLEDGRRTWIDISILGGTLVAYEGDKPVYATLVSPGRGGIPHKGIPTLETASTPVGTYPVVGKFLTATMFSSSNSDIVHAEVQYTQNFSGPYALHGAYWHDDFGDKKSGGCVNLAPIDARRIFRWTEPALPQGWHGMRTNDFKPKTLVRLHR